jgi:hypothetical protein
MLTRFHFLREPADLLGALRGDGWHLRSGLGGSVEGTHPDVADEDEARERLAGLGLLTSAALRIRFDHSRRAPGG